MIYTKKLFLIFDYLKEEGLIKSYVELAVILKTNKVGVSDLKAGRKRVSIENLESMKKSYPLINLDWWILNEGEMILPTKSYSIAAEPLEKYGNVTIDTLNRLITAQEKTIMSLETQLAIKSQENNTTNTSRPIPR